MALLILIKHEKQTGHGFMLDITFFAIIYTC